MPLTPNNVADRVAPDGPAVHALTGPLPRKAWSEPRPSEAVN